MVLCAKRNAVHIAHIAGVICAINKYNHKRILRHFYSRALFIINRYTVHAVNNLGLVSVSVGIEKPSSNCPGSYFPFEAFVYLGFF